MVRWHHGDAALTVGTPGEAGGIGPPAPRPSRALWRLSSAAQPPAWGNHPNPTSARPRRAGGVPHVAVLELGAAAPASLCAGYGPLPVLSVRDPTAHRRHHAG